MSATTWAVLVLVGAGAAAGRPRAQPRRPGEAASARRPRRYRARRPRASALDTLPDLLDLLVVAAGAGLPALPAFVAVSVRAPAPWDAVARTTVADVARGRLAGDALLHLTERHGELARPLVAVLRAALDDGDAFAPGLAALAADTRDLRRRHAEEAARRIPVRLLLPLVTCSLPAAAVLTVVPIVAGALDGLRFPT